MFSRRFAWYFSTTCMRLIGTINGEENNIWFVTTCVHLTSTPGIIGDDVATRSFLCSAVKRNKYLNLNHFKLILNHTAHVRGVKLVLVQGPHTA